MFEIPCKVDAENWYWNRQLQIRLAERGIRWAYKMPVGWNSRRRKYLIIAEGKSENYLAWATKLQFESYDMPEYTARELCLKL